jgi:DNA-binding transcriptional LysR family regulator
MVKAGLQHGFYSEFIDACAQAGATVHPAQYTRDISSKLWLISAGFGIAPTTAAVSRIKWPGLSFRPLPSDLPPVKIVIAWRRNNASPILRNFLDCLTSQPVPTAKAPPA